MHASLRCGAKTPGCSSKQKPRRLLNHTTTYRHAVSSSVPVEIPTGTYFISRVEIQIRKRSNSSYSGGHKQYVTPACTSSHRVSCHYEHNVTIENCPHRLAKLVITAYRVTRKHDRPILPAISFKEDWVICRMTLDLGE